MRRTDWRPFLRKANRLTGSENTIVGVCRLLCLGAAVGVASFGILVRLLYPQYEDPAWMRIGVSLFFLALVVLSYASGWVRNNIIRVCRGSVYVLTAWLILLCVINNFIPDLVIGLVVTINVSAAGFFLDMRRSRPLVVYLLFTFCTVLLALLATRDPQVWIAHFVGLLLIDMFVIYLTSEGRLAVVRQRRQTEERYRAFAATVSEGFFQFTLEQPLDPDVATRDKLREYLFVHSRVTECNGEMCKILGVQFPHEVFGASMQDLFGSDVKSAAESFIGEGFRLTGWKHSIVTESGHVRHFIVNAVGTWDGSYLTSVIGSCVEVTEQIENERRMVSLLEEHEGRIGRDLHNETGQILTSLRMLSNSLARRYFREGNEGYEQARQVADLAKEAHGSVHRIYRRLTPRRLESDTLPEALEALVLQSNVLPDVRVRFVGDEALCFRDPEVKLQLYRIAQEALANAIKHAGASEVLIQLYRENEHVVLEVHDNGQGFDVSAAATSAEAIGLYSMRYRADSIKAAFHINSACGAGTRVCCSLPTTACDDVHSGVPEQVD